jgi:hypothetical protein
MAYSIQLPEKWKTAVCDKAGAENGKESIGGAGGGRVFYPDGL